MRWEDERYVRIYTRDTADWLALCWQAKALLPLLLRKADRAGIVALRPGQTRARLVAGLTGLPLEVVQPGIEDLKVDGSLVETEAGYVFRNFIDAQETEASDAKRAREYRERSRDKELAGVTKRDESSRLASRNVTIRSPAFENVTPNRAVPSVPSLPKEEEEANNAPLPSTPKENSLNVTARSPANVLDVFGHYRTTFSAQQREPDQLQRALIEGRLREGYSVEDLKRAITGLSRSDWHKRKGQVKLGAALQDGERIENCWRWLEHPPDEAAPGKGRASEADRDWTRPVAVDADGEVVL